jgi:hypothetical protein
VRKACVHVMAVEHTNGLDLYSQTKYARKMDELILIRNENMLTGRKTRGHAKNSEVLDTAISVSLEGLNLNRSKKIKFPYFTPNYVKNNIIYLAKSHEEILACLDSKNLVGKHLLVSTVEEINELMFSISFDFNKLEPFFEEEA